MSVRTPRTDSALALAAQAGDARAADELASRYLGEVSRAVGQYFVTGGNRDDVAGEACVGLAKAIRTFRPGRASFQRFAHLCALRQVQTAMKTSGRNKHRVHLEAVSLSHPIGKEGDDTLELQDALANDGAEARDPANRVIELADFRQFKADLATKLSPGERASVIGLMVGATYDEIKRCESLRGDRKSVDNAITRARRKLRPNTMPPDLQKVA